MKMAGYAHSMDQTAALIRGYTRTEGQGKNIMPTPLGGGGIKTKQNKAKQYKHSIILNL